MEFIAFIIIIVLFVLFLNVSGRVKRLEAIMRSGVPVAPKTQEQVPVAGTVPTPQAPIPAMLQPLVSTGPNSLERFGHWLKEDWLLKIGALLLLIGFGWLASYAFLHNWIGPMGRIVFGIVCGVILLVLGWWRIQKFISQGGVFMVLGSTVIILTVFAGRILYDFFTPLSALGIMFLSAVFVAVASVKYNNRALAISSLILASIAPLLIHMPRPDDIMMFSYLLVIVLGTIWITLLTGRRELPLIALIIVACYSAPHFVWFFGNKPSDTLLLFAFVFAGIFFITNTAGIIKANGKSIMSDLATAAGNGLLLLFWIMTNAQEEWRSLIIAAWMVVFLVAAFLVYRFTGRKEPFYTYAAVGITMLAAATSAELDGATLTIAYIIEVALISVVTYLIVKDIRMAERASMLMIGPIILSFKDIIAPAWRTGMFHEHFVVLFLLAVLMLALGSFFASRNKRIGKGTSSEALILLVVGSLYAYLLLWLSLHAELARDDHAVMISLVIYTIIGLVTYFMGRAHQKKTLQVYGGILLAFVIGRLLFVDVWRMELSGRIITFFIIGALLMSTAFLGRKKNTKVIETTNSVQ